MLELRPGYFGGNRAAVGGTQPDHLGRPGLEPLAPGRGSRAASVEVGPVSTERLLGEKASRGRVSARAASAADCFEAALAALAFVGLRIAKLLKDRRIGPDVGERLDTRVAGADRQIAARIDLADVRDET